MKNYTKNISHLNKYDNSNWNSTRTRTRTSPLLGVTNDDREESTDLQSTSIESESPIVNFVVQEDHHQII
jgi:hypothetical protein